ncbi:MAG: polysaccharide deacetylase family protein [Clostridia bacterium]|nr:polysaccharide deacetylase family protein [Clostridia bacterium]
MNKKTDLSNKNKKTKILLILLVTVTAVLLSALLFVAAGVGILVYFNEFTITMTLHGDESVTVEYGEEYTEEGAAAVFKGTVFKRKPTQCPVEINGNVDVTRVGSYEVEYTSTYILDYYIGKKEFTVSDVRDVKVVDSVPPVIELVETEGHYTLPGQPYGEEGYSASDNYDGDITHKVTSEEKDGKVYYSVLDSSGNRAETVRDIFYDDPIPPEIKLLGDGDIVIAVGGSFKEPGYEASDNVDGVITDKVTVSGGVNTAKAGKYTLTYSVTDQYENTTTVSRVVTVRERAEMPEIEEGKEYEVLHTDPINPNGKVIYLTFDDGPGRHTPGLLDVLKKYDIKATFFVVNTGDMSILTRMEAEGHTVAMHSNTHNYEEIYADDDAYFNDLTAIENAIKDKIKSFRKLLRFPGGSSNMVSKKYNEGIMTRLTEMVKQRGYRYFDWNVSSGDAGETKDTDKVYDNVIKGIEKNHYSVVLQHDIHDYSVDAVERIIIWGLENGYTFKALTENSPVCEHNINN